MRLARPEWALEIERLRGKLNLSQAALAKLLNVSAMAPSRWERGINEPTGEIYIQLGKLIGAPQCWTFWRRAGLERQDVAKVLAQPTLENQSDESSDLGLSVLSIVKASWSGELEGGVVPHQHVAEQLAVPRTWSPHPEQTVCIRLEDDAMAPDLRKDYVVAVDLAVNKTKDVLQEIVAAKWQNRIVVRRLEAGAEGAVLVATDSTFPALPLSRAGTVLGKALWWIAVRPEKSSVKLRKAVSGSVPISSR